MAASDSAFGVATLPWEAAGGFGPGFAGCMSLRATSGGFLLGVECASFTGLPGGASVLGAFVESLLEEQNLLKQRLARFGLRSFVTASAFIFWFVCCCRDAGCCML